MRHAAIPCLWALLASGACGQSATIVVTHDDLDGIVTPGQAVTIALTLTHNGMFMAGDWRGDARATPNIGTAQAPFSNLQVFSNGSAGTVNGGGVHGLVCAAPAPFFWFGPYNQWVAPSIEFLRYTWIAPAAAGQVAFEWSPAPEFPVIQGYTTGLSTGLSPFASTYIGTSLTVVPAPASSVLLLAAVGMTARRARHGAW